MNYILSIIHRVRLPEKQLFWYRSPQHHNNYVASIVFCFDRNDDQYAFAYCYPYSYNRLQKYLEAVERRRLTTFHRQLLHLTLVRLSHTHPHRSRVQIN